MAASRGRVHPIVVAIQPFQVKILTLSIKICAGCRNGYARGEDGRAPPPLDLRMLGA